MANSLEMRSPLLDQGRWQAFASLPAAERRAYLAGAARGRASRELLRERARGVLEFASSLAPGAAYSPVAVRRLIALISSRERSRPVSRPNSRFAAILRDITAAPDRAGEGSDANAQGASEENGSDFLAAALAFGIVAETEGGITLNSLPEEDRPLSFVVSPSFSVTVIVITSYSIHYTKLYEFMARRSPDSVKVALSKKRDDEDPKDRLEKEKKRLEKTIAMLTSRLEQVEQSLSNM